MLQTRTNASFLFKYLTVSSPQGNATNTGFWTKWPPHQPVSSPQGNATNKRNNSQEIMTEEASFKSPRECYKLHSSSTPASIKSCFKSPRECYKQSHLRNYANFTRNSFKSPRECYKRFLLFLFLLHSLSFKSPRECYKPWQDKTQWARDRPFQVPKGMLQTVSRPYFPLKLVWVSSPQGNATNGISCSCNEYRHCSFKSPRECYKHPDTDEMKVTMKSFKSPRECYKLV